MSAKDYSNFEDSVRKGTKIALTADDTLCLQSFATRSCEIKAISNWAYTNGICLKSEFYFQPANGEKPAFVVTYDYQAQLQKEEHKPRKTYQIGLLSPISETKKRRRQAETSNQEVGLN